jgi:transcriptional regulator with XRE-family HTH domain
VLPKRATLLYDVRVSETVGAARLLRRLREERGKSLRGAAEDLGVAPSHLSRLERGEKYSSMELQQRTARYYGISEDLIGLEQGRLPFDIVDILQAHPELLDEIRHRFAKSP